MATEAAAPTLTRDDYHEREKAAFLAGEDFDDEKPAAPVEADEDEAEETESVEAASDDDRAEEDSPDEEQADEDEAADDEKPDAETSKRLEQVRRTEARFREQMKREQASFAAERDAFVAEWKPKVEAAERFEKLRESARNPYAIVDLLAEAGMSEDDFEAAAQTLYAHSTKGKAEPKNREVIARSKREREMAEELRQIKTKLAEREQAERSQAEAARLAAQGKKIVEDIAKAAKPEKAPLLTAALAKNAEKTHNRLAQIASEMFDSLGYMPEPKAVHAEYERIRRDELAELGIDPATVIKAVPKKPAIAKAAPKNGNKTTTEIEKNGTGTEAPPTREQILRELEELS